MSAQRDEFDKHSLGKRDSERGDSEPRGTVNSRAWFPSSLSLHSTWAIRKRPVDVDAGAPLQYGQSTSQQADTSGPPLSCTHGQTYGWLELTRTDQMIDSYLFETTVVKTPS